MLVDETSGNTITDFTHNITEFLDSDLNPLTYYYTAQSYYLDGSIIKSVSKALLASSQSSTPELRVYKLYSGTFDDFDLNAEYNIGKYPLSYIDAWAKADGGLMQIVGTNVYWICQMSFQRRPDQPPRHPVFEESSSLFEIQDRSMFQS